MGLSFCLRDLTSRTSNRAISERAYSVACERQKICGNLPETTAFKSYAAKHERKSQLLINPLTRGQLSPFDTQRSARGYPTSIKNIQPCPKRWLLTPLGVRTAATTRAATTRGRGQFPRTRIGLVGKLMQYACTEGLHFSAFHFCSSLFAALFCIPLMSDMV